MPTGSDLQNRLNKNLLTGGTSGTLGVSNIMYVSSNRSHDIYDAVNSNNILMSVPRHKFLFFVKFIGQPTRTNATVQSGVAMASNSVSSTQSALASGNSDLTNAITQYQAVSTYLTRDPLVGSTGNPNSDSNIWQSPSLTFRVKSIEKPKIIFTTEVLSQYNKKRIIQTKSDYTSTSLRFYDTVDNVAMSMWLDYAKYSNADFSHQSYKDWSEDILSAPGEYNSFFGMTANNRYGTDDNSFFQAIQIYEIFGSEYTMHTLVKPRIQNFDPDTLDYSNSGDIQEINISLLSEAILTQPTSQLTQELVDEFGLSRYSLDLTGTLPTQLEVESQQLNNNLIDIDKITTIVNSSNQASNVGSPTNSSYLYNQSAAPQIQTPVTAAFGSLNFESTAGSLPGSGVTSTIDYSLIGNTQYGWGPYNRLPDIDTAVTNLRLAFTNLTTLLSSNTLNAVFNNDSYYANRIPTINQYYFVNPLQGATSTIVPGTSSPSIASGNNSPNTSSTLIPGASSIQLQSIAPFFILSQTDSQPITNQTLVPPGIIPSSLSFGSGQTTSNLSPSVVNFLLNEGSNNSELASNSVVVNDGIALMAVPGNMANIPNLPVNQSLAIANNNNVASAPLAGYQTVSSAYIDPEFKSVIINPPRETLGISSSHLDAALGVIPGYSGSNLLDVTLASAIAIVQKRNALEGISTPIQLATLPTKGIALRYMNSTRSQTSQVGFRSTYITNPWSTIGDVSKDTYDKSISPIGWTNLYTRYDANGNLIPTTGLTPYGAVVRTENGSINPQG